MELELELELELEFALILMLELEFNFNPSHKDVGSDILLLVRLFILYIPPIMFSASSYIHIVYGRVAESLY